VKVGTKAVSNGLNRGMKPNLQFFAKRGIRWIDNVDDFLYHYDKHAAKVGARTIEEYYNKAIEFSRNLRGARTAVH
jgi:hypothetical protein